MKQLFCTLLLLGGVTTAATAPPGQQHIFTADIDHFWTAFDSVRTTQDRARQLAFMQRLYVDKGTEGLAAFMKARDYSTEQWVDLINKYPKYWASIRPNTLAVKTKTVAIEKSIRQFKKLYPELREAKLYFTIGGLRSGGTTKDNLVLIGTEIATGNAQTDVSEFPDKWLATVFQQQPQSLDNLVALNVHEYVHTQQHSSDDEILLSQALCEGACDFVAELVTGKPLQGSYVSYGSAHEATLREAFKQDMFSKVCGPWLYNGTNASTVADLGYFVGYRINKAYYTKAKDKRQALKKIVELNYADSAAVETFLQQSGYYPEGWNKPELAAALEAKKPILVNTTPFENGAEAVEASAKELVLHFSQAMSGRGMSFSPGPRGKENFPLKEAGHFSPDGKTLTMPLALQPNREYEFVVTNQSFASKDGYPLRQNYTIRFKTR
ncbi:DUF2268 domain-containing putative Zn-dependent protease [Hymenobacter terrenus]|uniref:DUF2268 domain-containing putative Zn-dependent protease n=1 Tax=Hymenobacter terrenus TaxID=1629124 RepID=UPI0006978815|nr:DUF2268 domain-containing putative Zn-dependent protease [Hymenobacter terrenus]